MEFHFSRLRNGSPVYILEMSFSSWTHISTDSLRLSIAIEAHVKYKMCCNEDKHFDLRETQVLECLKESVWNIYLMSLIQLEKQEWRWHFRIKSHVKSKMCGLMKTNILGTPWKILSVMYICWNMWLYLSWK